MNCVCCKKYGDCPVEKEPDGRDYLIESNGLNGIECTQYKRDFITPEQYKKRTGREWNEYAPVWAFYDHIIEISTMAEEEERKEWPGHFYACVMGDAIPPDDWKPEEEALYEFLNGDFVRHGDFDFSVMELPEKKR